MKCPFLTHPVSLVKVEAEKIRSKAEPGKKGGMGGEAFLTFGFISHNPILIQMVVNNTNFPS